MLEHVVDAPNKAFLLTAPTGHQSCFVPRSTALPPYRVEICSAHVRWVRANRRNLLINTERSQWTQYRPSL